MLTGSKRLELDDGIADSDDAADDDVGIDAGAMSECLDDPRSRHLLEMTTRLAEFHAEALDLADAEAFADEAVDIHIAHGHLSSSRARLQPDVLHNLGGNERQRLARGSPVGVEMTVALESLPGDRPHGLDSPQLGLAGSPEMNRLHWHRPIMHQPSVEGFVRGSFRNTGPGERAVVVELESEAVAPSADGDARASSVG